MDESVIAYRLTSVDKRLEDITNSIEKLTGKVDDLKTKGTMQEAAFKTVESQVADLRAELDDIVKDQRSMLEQLGNLRLGLAQKIGPGAVAGGTLAVVIQAVAHLLHITVGS